MKAQTLAELAQVAAITPEQPWWAVRRARLERLAQLLREHEGPIALLSGIEYMYRPARMKLRRDYSPLALAFADPVLRGQGLAGDMLGDAMSFFSINDGEAHAMFCDCHYRNGVSSAVLAQCVSRVAARVTVTERWHRIRSLMGA